MKNQIVVGNKLTSNQIKLFDFIVIKQQDIRRACLGITFRASNTTDEVFASGGAVPQQKGLGLL